MLVSVIIPVRNESAHIQQTLAHLHRQEFDADEFEIIVVDGESEDQTVFRVQEVAHSFRHLHVLSNPKRYSSAARNLGIRHARGQYILIVDGHCAIHNRHYLSNLIEAFMQSGADCLGRPQPLRSNDATDFQDAVALARESWLGHNPDSANFSNRPRFVSPDNVAVAYRREVFDRVGLFDEQFDACEDVEFNTRVRQAGMTCYFTPSIRVDYQPRETLRGLIFQMFRYGTGRSRLSRKHPGSVTLPSLAPAVWLIWLPLSFALGFLSPLFAVAFCLSLLFYSISVLCESLRLTVFKRSRLGVHVPFIFFSIHIGYGWGFLRERLRNAKPASTKNETAVYPETVKSRIAA